MKKYTTLLLLLVLTAFNGFTQNNWVQKASMTGGSRRLPTAFSLNGMGYVGTGYTGNSQSDFWKYNPLKNTWSQIASIASARQLAYSFSVDSFGYVGGGYAGNNYTSPFASFYKYNPYTNNWTSIKSLNNGLFRGTSFSSDGKGYIVMGYNGSSFIQDLWQYDPANDSWNQKSDFPGSARGNSVAFTIGKNSYVGLGFDGSTYYSDFYCYNSDSDTWHQVSSFSGGGVNAGMAFAASGKGYAGGGYDGTNDLKTFYEYDPANDTWTKKKDFAGNAFRSGVAISIGSRGYMGVGEYNVFTLYSSWYMYETLARSISADSIGMQSHCKGGKDSVYFTAVNIFDTANKFTVQISNDNFKTSLNAGSIKGVDEGKYVAAITIPTNAAASDSFSFRIVSSNPSFAGSAYPLYFSVLPTSSPQLVSTKDSICDGDSSSIYLVKRDNGSTLKWYKDGNLLSDTGTGITTTSSGKFYVEETNLNGCPVNSSGIDVVVNPIPVAEIFSANTTVCSGDSVQLISVNTTGGYEYSWLLDGNPITGANKKKLHTNQSGKYQLSITNSFGCSDISTETTVTINPKPDAQIFGVKDSTCVGDTLTLISVNNSTGDVYEWMLNSTKINGATTATLFATKSGNYTLKIISQNSCSDLSATKPLAFISLAKPTISASGTLLISSVAANYQWYLNGTILQGETLQFITPKKNGQYTVSVNNYLGCSAISDASIVSNIIGFGIVEQNDGIILFPNPTADECTLIVNSQNTNNWSVKMVNSLGQVIFSKNIISASTNLNLGQFQSGVYLIQVWGGDILIGVHRIVKQ